MAFSPWGNAPGVFPKQPVLVVAVTFVGSRRGVGLRYFLGVGQSQGDVLGLARAHEHILFLFAKNALARSAHFVAVGSQLGDREVPLGVRVHRVRRVSSRGLIANDGV